MFAITIYVNASYFVLVDFSYLTRFLKSKQRSRKGICEERIIEIIMDKDIYWKLPKVNLHHHLEGAVRPETFFEVASRHQLGLPIANVSDSKRFLQVSADDSSLADFLVKVDRSLAVSQYPGVLTRMAFEAVEDGYYQNVKYLELRFGPWLHIEQRRTIEEAIEEVLIGIEQAVNTYPITAKLIVCALRHHDEKKNMKLASVAGKYLNYGLVGFDIAGDEAAYPAKVFHKTFAQAKADGLGITVHAGEVGSGNRVIEAITHLNADRIGHGIQIVSQPDLVDQVKQHGVTLEICPTSNVDTRAVKSPESHPIRKLYQQGVLLSLGDDDPTTSGITITSEYRLLSEKFNFTNSELADIVMTGAKAAFLPQDQKSVLIEQLTASLAEWEKQTNDA